MVAGPSKHSKATTDPALTRQLDAAHGSGRPVEAVFILREPDSGAMRSANARDRAQSVIDRVEHEVGTSPEAVNVLANLGVVVVVANEAFVRKLLDQPEVASAAANAPDA